MRRGKEEVLLLTTTLFSIFNDGNAFAVLIGACKWENLVSFYVAWGYKSRARAQQILLRNFFIQREERRRKKGIFALWKRKNKRRQIHTLADKPCVEQTLFEKFNRVGADAANDIIIYGSYYGLKWRIPTGTGGGEMFLEQRAAFFSVFLEGTRRRKRELERKQFLYLKKYCTDVFRNLAINSTLRSIIH